MFFLFPYLIFSEISQVKEKKASFRCVKMTLIYRKIAKEKIKRMKDIFLIIDFFLNFSLFIYLYGIRTHHYIAIYLFKILLLLFILIFFLSSWMTISGYFVNF